MAFKRPGVRLPSAPPGKTKGSNSYAAFFMALFLCRFVEKRSPRGGSRRGSSYCLSLVAERERKSGHLILNEARYGFLLQLVQVLDPFFPLRCGGLRAPFCHVSISFWLSVGRSFSCRRFPRLHPFTGRAGPCPQTNVKEIVSDVLQKTTVLTAICVSLSEKGRPLVFIIGSA